MPIGSHWLTRPCSIIGRFEAIYGKSILVLKKTGWLTDWLSPATHQSTPVPDLRLWSEIPNGPSPQTNTDTHWKTQEPIQMPIAAETIRQGGQGEARTEEESGCSKQQQLVEELKNHHISGNVPDMFGLDGALMMGGAMMMDGTILLDGMGGEYAPMLLEEYTSIGDECSDLSFFGLPSPTAQLLTACPSSTEPQSKNNAPASPSEVVPCESKPVRAMTEEEMSSLLTFVQEAPERATHNLRNKRVGDLRGAAAKHILKTTGQSIHCVIWEGKHYISSYDIIKVLKVLVIDDGQGRMYDEDIDIESKKFEENVFSVLRQLKVGVNCQLEEARSDFLDWLVRHDCIRTQKKQKVFYWHDVNVTVMAKEIRNRCLRNGIPTKSILVGPRSSDGTTTTTANNGTTGHQQAHAYPTGAKLPIQPQHKKPRLDAAYPSIQSQYMMPYGMSAPQRIQQMAQAYQAYQLQLQQHLQMQQQGMQGQQHQVQPAPTQQQQQQQQVQHQEPYCQQQYIPQEYSTLPYQDMLVSPEQIPQEFYMNYLNVPQSPVQTTVTQSASSPSFSMQSQLNEDSSPVMSYVEPGVLDMSNYPFTTGPQSYYEEPAYYYPPSNRHAPISPINERKHMCNICGRGFKRNEHLKRHEFTHTGEKRHACKYCNKLFARSDNLQQHLKQTHKKEWEDEEEQSRRTPRGGNSPNQGGLGHLNHMHHMSQMGLFDQRPSAPVQETIGNADDLDAMLNFHFANSLVDLDKLNL